MLFRSLTSQALDGDSVFEIGSVTKVFTATLLSDMVERGEVSLNDPISKFLPRTVKTPTRNGKEITLLDLATQTSGLPRRPWFKHQIYAPGFYTGYGVKTLPAIREAIEQRNWTEAEQQIKLVSETITSIAEAIDRSTLLLK